jgi:putative membrane protein
MVRLKHAAWLGAGAGLAGFIGLVALQGWHDVAAAIAHGGWPLLLVVPARVATLALDTRAWRVLLERADPAHAAGSPFLLWVAAVRDAINCLLPVAGVGGDVVGIRLVCLRVDDKAGVIASVVVEVLLTIGVLTLFCGAGVILMARIAAGMPQVGLIALCLSLSLPLPVLAWWLLRYGAPFAWLERTARRLLTPSDTQAARQRAASRRTPLDGAGVDAAIRALFERPVQLARACGWSLLSYVLGAFETWYALRLLGHPVPVDTAVAIEALTQATRHAGFIVPAGLGVQEAATMLFGHLAGVGGNVALALALVKRMREVVLGLPALLSWQWIELRRFTAGDYAPPST